tara:strand:- start:8 stop:568 length:561 start_codon:yes stop_codon:yes gene_type:complete
MLKRDSALDSHYLPGSYPLNDKISVRFKEFNNLILQQLACWPNTLSETENFFKKELNVNNSPSFNKGIIKEEYSLWRMEPFKWWVLEKELNFPNELGTSLDMSHSFTCINIFGDNATLLLNRHLPIDLRENKFSLASSASSAIHHVSIKLLKISNNNYYLLIPRGFGLSIWEILLETAKQFGYEIK